MIHGIKKFFGLKKSYPFELCYWLLTRNAHQQVQSGPFKGMLTYDCHIGSPYVPRLLGIYEKELHFIIEQWIVSLWDHIIDVGAAEGYYAVGLAMKCPKTRVTAFEMEKAGQEAISLHAKDNKVQDRIRICGRCDPAELRKAIKLNEKTLIIVDVEGYEIDLLDVDQIPELMHCSILAELHDQFNPRISGMLRQRFEGTHHIQQIVTRDREIKDLPNPMPFVLATLLKKWLRMIIGDSRGIPMAWYWMVPK
jgi:hypothetical protein